MPSLTPRAHADSLCDALRSLLSDRPHPASVRHVIDVSIRMALAYLHQKKRLGSLRPEHFGLSIKDLAIDSTADIFRRNDAGHYVELRTYFQSIDWEELDETDLTIAFRRIVFSKVSESLFRRFRENDPNLAKVIRNIKDVARSTSEVRLERVGSQRWLVLGKNEPLESGKPVAPSEIVESYVTSALGSNGVTEDALSALRALLERNPHYRNGFPVSEFAKVVRSSFVRLGAPISEDAEHSGFSTEEVARAIDLATAVVERRFYSTYVASRKVDAKTFGVYVSTVRDVLQAQYVHGTESAYSHFNVLATHQPDVTERDYRRRHRNRVEYMVKAARTEVVEFLAGRPALSATAA